MPVVIAASSAVASSIAVVGIAVSSITASGKSSCCIRLCLLDGSGIALLLVLCKVIIASHNAQDHW